MLKIVSSICAAVMAISIPFATPAVAMPAPISAPVWDKQGPTEVQYRYRDNRRGYYRGHRGYRYQRPGYRYHDGYWFPPAAFIAGAIIGGAIANQEPPIRYRPRATGGHVEWCYARYRSYRAYDNSYQPYNGPRRQCRSPYG
ncbi:BA14K family protein [Mesorhizobium microcysteis]|uniref:Lectin-like protein BA14k n=1 Tax=Neoaquamicrobium microcysteis TaxID=2682781 RepID=A0A5D4H4P1_9HYPH|nr:BA14K family protein [Mesorhizobium microcysteis]TYR35223.1 BA14K family protein [Mesorhizobium microcysteis]